MLQTSSPTPDSLMVPETSVLLVMRAVPFTWRVLAGDSVPMPTAPLKYPLVDEMPWVVVKLIPGPTYLPNVSR